MESFFRRVPGLGTALTKAAMQDIEEQGVKVCLCCSFQREYLQFTP